MKNWELFELECFKYLKKKYPNKKVEYYGKHNSTVPDIKVDDIFIECKHCPAQCTQFVLFPVDNKFMYSLKNKNPKNRFSQNIINYMNANFDSFSENVKKQAIEYPGCEEDFFGCIKEFYKRKNVKYFITNNFLIIPLEKINDYFNVSAVYRAKKSGSRKPSKALIDELMVYINSTYKPESVSYNGKSLLINTPNNLDKVKFNFNGFDFMFSKVGNVYAVRQLSNVNNKNVIFSITLKK